MRSVNCQAGDSVEFAELQGMLVPWWYQVAPIPLNTTLPYRGEPHFLEFRTRSKQLPCAVPARAASRLLTKWERIEAGRVRRYAMRA